jgi:hypothetical protein
MTLQLMPPKAAFAAKATAGDCSHIGVLHDDAGAAHRLGDGADLPECIKQMGCLGTPSLPLRLCAGSVPCAYAKVIYSTPAVVRDGGFVEPDLFPPIGL